MTANSEEYFNVSEINQFIKDVVQSGFPQPLWICGEIQGYDRNKGRNHVFFELIEKDKITKDVKAKIGLVIFAGKKAEILRTCKDAANAFELKDDIEVKFLCRIDFYAPHGAVRLIVESIDPVYTLGRLAQEKQKLINELKKEGVLDKNKLLSIPAVPLNIGLITADDSAAYNDFVDELGKSQFSFQLYVKNALMQGKNAESDICRAMDHLKGIKNLDLVVITRGGGSIADLSCFDSRMIAEKIAGYSLPVMTGIGHEINISVADLAAHTYEKTPTAAAQFLVRLVREFSERLDAIWEHIQHSAGEKINGHRNILRNDAQRLQSGTQHFLKAHQETLVRLREMIKHQPVMFIAKRKQVLQQQTKSLYHKSLGLLGSEKGNIKHQKTLAINAVNRHIAKENKKIGSYEKIVDIVNPLNTMKRGFAIPRNSQGRLLTSVKKVSSGDAVSMELHDGLITSQIQEISVKEK